MREARLDVSRTSTGYALRLRYATELSGPCVRCLEPAATQIEIDAREVDQPSVNDEELRSPYVTDGNLDVGRWANDALVLAFPRNRSAERTAPGSARSAASRSTTPIPKRTATRAAAIRGWRSCATSSWTVSLAQPSGG